MIDAVTKANQRTVVVLETCAPVLTPWRGGRRRSSRPGTRASPAARRSRACCSATSTPAGACPATFPRARGGPATCGDPRRFPGDGGVVAVQGGRARRLPLVRRAEARRPPTRSATASPTRASATPSCACRGDRVSAPRAQRRPAHRQRRSRSSTSGMPQPAPGVVQPPRQLKGFRKLRLGRARPSGCASALDAALVLLLGRAAGRLGGGARVLPAVGGALLARPAAARAPGAGRGALPEAALGGAGRGDRRRAGVVHAAVAIDAGGDVGVGLVERLGLQQRAGQRLELGAVLGEQRA